MANPTWPTTLPNPSATQTAQYAPLSSDLVTTSVQGGPPKVRSASTFVPDVFTFTVTLDASQVQTLTTFRDSILHKIGTFDWTDWRTQQPCSYYFAERPTFSFVQGSCDRWNASIKLVVVP